MSGKNSLKIIGRELIHHLPFSAVGVAAALGILLGLERLGGLHAPSKQYFHITHPLHIFLSAVVTTAIFWKYTHKWLKAVLVGFFGVIPLCTLSDVGIPYFGGLLLHTPIALHLCIIEEPWLVLPACFAGIFLGIVLLAWVERLTEVGHLAHVLVSSLASLLYLVTFDLSLWQDSLWLVFGITVLAVWIPCCLSDIVFPILFIEGDEVHPGCHHHHH